MKQQHLNRGGMWNLHVRLLQLLICLTVHVFCCRMTAEQREMDACQRFVLEEIAALKSSLTAATQAREQTDDEIVQAFSGGADFLAVKGCCCVRGHELLHQRLAERAACSQQTMMAQVGVAVLLSLGGFARPRTLRSLPLT
eukprot:6460263-Amphidinium_carterae.1